MSFVKSAAEVARIEAALSSASWSGEWVGVPFLTTEETARAVLPPPLQPAAEPVAFVSIGRWQSSCLGFFSGGSLSISAVYEGIPGAYILAIYMDSEPASVFGRELFGEPKKSGSSGLYRNGSRVHAHVSRHGVRLLEVDAEIGDDRGASDYTSCTYNVKARTAACGRGLEEDAILTRSDVAVRTLSRQRGPGRVTLRRSPHDPLDQIEVVELRTATYAQDVSAPRTVAVATIPAEQFLPYHYGRQDDWLALDSGYSEVVPEA